jgi:hypothetical protein
MQRLDVVGEMLGLLSRKEQMGQQLWQLRCSISVWSISTA